MFETKSKPYLAWQDYGKMVNAARPKGLVVVSAHWEDEAGGPGVTGEFQLITLWKKLTHSQCG
jgi:aromatic ring-opening dioxygenase catalytic subunit (LigB family)